MFSSFFLILMIYSGFAEESIPQASLLDCKEKDVDSNEETLAEIPESFPQTSFTCWDKYDGYYADVDVDCTVFHYCQTWRFPSGYNQTVKWDFVCPHSTIFNQKLLACTPPSRTLECQESVDYYYVNYYVYNPTTAPEVSTSPQPAYEFNPDFQVGQSPANNQMANEFYGGTKPYDGLVFSGNDQSISSVPSHLYPSDPGSFGNIPPNAPIEMHSSGNNYPESYEPAYSNHVNEPDSLHLPDVNSDEEITGVNDGQLVGQHEIHSNNSVVDSSILPAEQSVNQVPNSLSSETSVENDVPTLQNEPSAVVPDVPNSSSIVPDVLDTSPVIPNVPDSSPAVPEAQSNGQPVNSNEDYNFNSGTIEKLPDFHGPDGSESNKPISNGEYTDQQFIKPIVHTGNVAPEQPYTTDLNNSSVVTNDVSFPTESNLESTYEPPLQDLDESASNTDIPIHYPIDSNGFHENSRPSAPYQTNTNPTVENNEPFVPLQTSTVNFLVHGMPEEETHTNSSTPVEPVVTYPAVLTMFPNKIEPTSNAQNDSLIPHQNITQSLHDDLIDIMKLESEASEIFGKKIRPYPIVFSSFQNSNESTEKNTDDELVFQDEDYQKYSVID